MVKGHMGNVMVLIVFCSGNNFHSSLFSSWLIPDKGQLTLSTIVNGKTLETLPLRLSRLTGYHWFIGLSFTGIFGFFWPKKYSGHGKLTKWNQNNEWYPGKLVKSQLQGKHHLRCRCDARYRCNLNLHNRDNLIRTMLKKCNGMLIWICIAQ